ncbi:MAG: AraC family transcriptional regulator [Saprospiraceae bacterium]|nr:AraC family transcriptional regulator [Saprospiraceae bacterium]
MRAAYEHLSENIENSFLYRRFSLPQFDAPFHYHPELELTFIEQSEGRRFVGQQVADFVAGDLVLLGENVPHCWLNNVSHTEGIGSAKSIVIQFRKDFLGDTFLNLPEMGAVNQLFQKAQSGILIKGKTRDKVVEKMDFSYLTSFQKLIQLIEILQIIAISDEIELIDTQFSSSTVSMLDTERFRKVYAYIIENYQQEISLEAVAAVAHLTPTAFCRYFKKMTRKTLVDVILEFRLKHACQLLISTEKSVSDICFDSGFGNISYFNKQFKNALGHSPLNYRKMFYRI